ncbi:carboxylic ester hydrolase-25 [Coleophoma crateriformis]|uniref:Carboxylic ester hydrolase n=1 Tax=Coleophoma crateriformis TaxID=565419 RepID=A0A3D8RCL1_9HELO|nr:carboxylic ester hydrolase-25 [Coleophoma crateriformis]
MTYVRYILGVCLLPVAVAAATVNLVDGSQIIGATAQNVDTFTGIPYAEPPTGNLRLKPPQPLQAGPKTIQATGVPTGCPQFVTSTTAATSVSNRLYSAFNQVQLDTNATSPAFGEDCLTLNVQRPANATAASKLPVVYWIFGGGFEFGSTQTYDATQLVNTSVAQGKDIVYVAVNYRLGGFGFMPGKEVVADGSTNLGLLDQRLGLQWVADNIAAFGGDPSKVTIWGESAGSISVFNQMALYDGNNTYKGAPLFRAAVMDSGSVVPADPVNCTKGQAVYDTVVANAGCAQSADTLACLRAASYDTFLKAANSVPGITSFNSVALSYLPRPDGVALTQSPEVLVQQGKFAQVPFIVGDQEDEGTLFSLAQKNLTTTADVENYLSTIFFKDASTAQVQQLVVSYPDDPTAGSPFGTGMANNIYPQYKRLAAILGDATFTLTRRGFLAGVQAKYPTLKTYSYLNTYGFGTAQVGTAHASDIAQVYGQKSDPASTTIQAYYVSFFNTMDPNGAPGLMPWPTWAEGNNLMNFTASGGSTLIPDTFRNDSFTVLINNQGSFHI